MKQNNLIVCDVDDYLICWIPHYIEWLWSNKLSEIDTYDSTTWFKPEYIFKEFNKTHVFANKRSRIDSTCHFIKERLYSKDCDVLFVSACGKENLHQYKTLSIALDIPLYEPKITLNLVCVDHSPQKIKVVKEHLRNNSYDKILVLDDNLKTCQLFQEHVKCETYNKHDYETLNNIWKKYK